MKFLKQNWFKMGILFFLSVLSVIYYFDLKSNDTSLVQKNSIFSSQKKYYLKFWESLSKGDVTSTECQKAVEKYSEQNSHFSKSFYSYEKKRCFGFNEYINNNGGTRVEEVIVDVVTGAELVSCADTKIDKEHTLSCKDSKNSWYWEEGKDSLPFPEPWPIFLKVWNPLRDLNAK